MHILLIWTYLPDLKVSDMKQLRPIVNSIQSKMISCRKMAKYGIQIVAIQKMQPHLTN
jgi:hypothetical protein